MSQNNVLTDNKPPLVSICCLVYNHEEYLKQALDSFLMQKTTFPFEIIIHDDASTDNSANIIKEYTLKYPNLFKPLYQTENQKSKVKSGMNPRFNFPRAKGKYIAICEGDDYWTDPYKLEKQVNLLENNSHLIACHHWQKIAKYENGKYVEYPAPKEGHGYLGKKTSDVKDIFLNKVRLKSRTLMFENLIDTSLFNSYFNNVAFGDVSLSFILGKYGDFGFIDEEMAVYRLTDKGASTAGLKELGFKKFTIQHFKNWIEIWDRADVFYDFKYHKESFKTVKFFYTKIITQFNFNFSTLLKLLKYNRNRELPYINLFKHDLWLIWTFFKLNGNKAFKRFKNFIK